MEEENKVCRLMCKTLQVIYDPTSAAGKGILPQVESLTFHSHTPPPPRIRRPHLPSGDKIDINLKSLFKDEYFISVCNIVAVCSWMPLPNLSYIAHYAPNIELTSSNTSAILIRVDKIMCRMFTTGVAVFTASRTIEQTKYEAHQYRLFINSIPVPVMIFDRTNPNHKPYFELRTLEPLSEFIDFKIVNIVARAIANEVPLDLMQIVNNIGTIGEASWSPEHFPGARVCLKRSEALPFVAKSVVTHVFDTGKNMIMGVNLDDMKMAQQFICKWVRPFVDHNLPINPLNRHEYRKMRMLSFGSIQQQQGLTRQGSIYSTPTTGENVQQSIINFLDESNVSQSMLTSIQGKSTFFSMSNSLLRQNQQEDDRDDDEIEVEEDAIEHYLDEVILSNLRRGNIIRRR